ERLRTLDVLLGKSGRSSRDTAGQQRDRTAKRNRMAALLSENRLQHNGTCRPGCVMLKAAVLTRCLLRPNSIAVIVANAIQRRNIICSGKRWQSGQSCGALRERAAQSHVMDLKSCSMRLRAHRSNDFPPRGTTRIDRLDNSLDHIPIRIFEAAGERRTL